MRTHPVSQFFKENTSVSYDATLVDAGLDYIASLWANDVATQKTAQKSSLFWNWWSVQWKIRSAEIILELGFHPSERNLSPIEINALEEAYAYMHSQEMVNRIIPATVLYKEIKNNTHV